MGTTLDFVSSDVFRRRLITRNLAPYSKAPNRPTPPLNFEYIQSDSEVIDSPDQLIDLPTFADSLYPLNQWGAEGGYQQVPDPNGLLNTHSNEGEYGVQDAHIIDEALPESRSWKSINAFGDGTQTVKDGAQFIGNLDLITESGTLRYYDNQPYPNFNPSSYSPVSILLNPDPIGSDGLLSADSFIVRLGAKQLKREFEERIATEIIRNTVGRANIFNVKSGTDILNLATGRVPLIEPNYNITVPANPLLAATDFTLRLAGSIIPVSPIPGSYFDSSINSGQPTTIQQLSNAFKRTQVGQGFSRLLGADKTGSQLFLNNTGAGQKSRLFGNIDYNKYKPDYDRTLFDRVAGVVVGSTTDNSNYYVGSRTSDPSRVFSPGGDIPIDSFGREQQTPVYGPQELAQLYEGPSKDIKLGANGPTYSDGGGIEGGFTWVSPKYKGNAGKKVGPGGEITNEDQDFKPSSYNATESTNREYREGSILDDTQRIIDSQPQGGRRLQHVGNAIDQVSKVFNDGYKELTKGSRVLSYVGAIGQEVGTEYCRVFAKDVPYLQYNDLQKTNGMTTEGRKFAWSVMDKTYNLNMYPNKQEGGQDSTNLIGTGNKSYAKKYMFSIENLAWRTSNIPGFTVSDLAICERGPNGGRVMWFPPYGLTFSENVSADFNSTSFLGRPEPIYTYKSSSRTGSLSWKIVVDHPSVLNMIVNKVLKNETNRTRIDSIVESFFAGCRKYDLYELAKKYYTININDLYELQQLITSKEITKEQLTYAVKTIQTGVDSPVDGSNGQPVTSSNTNTSTNFDFNSYKNIAFYFDNDIPKTTDSSPNYNSEYGSYQSNVTDTYSKKSNGQQLTSFFESVVTPNYDKLKELALKIAEQFKQNQNGNITIYFNASCSAPATKTYNVELSNRRLQAAKNFFINDSATSTYYTNGRLLLQNEKSLGEEAQVLQYDSVGKKFTPGATVNCSDKDTKTVGGDTQVGSNEIYTTNAMACRRAYISNIQSTLQAAPKQDPPAPSAPKPLTNVATQDVLVGTVQPVTIPVQEVTTNWVERDNITKRVLRGLLSECDYFETIKEESPMVYDNLRDKLKFFQPAFHSTTPEGLNGRLTFLQQCMRPGDTIPTIKQVGETQTLSYNNATNTTFGAPPVLVLRVGDFYNTKIIPTSLAITYESLDINPEGIGIQPMIANIQMAFNFVGGSGLKESVDKLQNALTFNYYANTEMYDDRADVTDTSYKVLDKNFLQSIGAQPPVPTVNQTQNNNGQSNNDTIGTIITNVITASAETGVITYKTFMDKLVTESQNYFSNVVNKTKECVAQYNNGMLQNWTCDRKYVNGSITTKPDKIELFGKTNDLQGKINKIFDDYIVDIDSTDSATQDRFINFISQPTKNFNAKVIRQLRTNYKNFINGKKGTYTNAIFQISQSFVDQQQSYIQYLTRCNVIGNALISQYEGTDGLQQSNGNVKAYTTSGTTEVYDKNNPTITDTHDELLLDIDIVTSGVSEFYSLIVSNNEFVYGSQKYDGVMTYGDGSYNYNSIKEEVFVPFSGNENFLIKSFRRQYMILSPEILDDKKYATFKNEMIGNILNNTSILDSGNTDLEIQFDAYWQTVAKPIFQEENTITNSLIDNMEKGKLKNFMKYTPFPSKERKMTYEVNPTPPDELVQMIKALGAQTNQNTNNDTWDDIINNNQNYIIAKVKLN